MLQSTAVYLPHQCIAVFGAGGTEPNQKAPDTMQFAGRRRGPGSDPELFADFVAVSDLFLDASERVRRVMRCNEIDVRLCLQFGTETDTKECAACSFQLGSSNSLTCSVPVQAQEIMHVIR